MQTLSLFKKGCASRVESSLFSLSMTNQATIHKNEEIKKKLIELINHLAINSNHDITKAFEHYPVLTILGDEEIKAFGLWSNYNIFLSLMATTQNSANWYQSFFKKKSPSLQSINKVLKGIPNTCNSHATYKLAALHSLPSYNYSQSIFP